jgi:uncharacterized SAM-binding protein YcdF (DUF218 family)
MKIVVKDLRYLSLLIWISAFIYWPWKVRKAKSILATGHPSSILPGETKVWAIYSLFRHIFTWMLGRNSAFWVLQVKH